MRGTFISTFLAIAFLPCTAFAQDWLANAPGGKDLELLQIFRVETEGPRARLPGTQGDPGFISEVGTAFAISEDTLITAKHVPHEAREFRNTSQSSVVWIPDRIIEVSYAEEKLADPDVDETQRVTITPSPLPTIDASRINLNQIRARPFPLSACPIERGGEYFLIKMRGGDLGLPIVVPIEADINEHSGAGDLRLFTHRLNPGSRDMPRPGDSGSPILDKDGRVIGLLTAILPDSPDLYVTLTRNWLDLVPPGVDVACDLSVEQGDLRQLEASLLSHFEAEIRPMQSKLAELTEKVGILEAADEDIKAQLRDLNRALTTTQSNIFATVRAMLNRIDDEEITNEQFEKIVSLLREAELLPKVTQLVDELSEETWSFDYATFDADIGAHIVQMTYDRNISADPFASRMDFCFKPMFPPREGVDIDDLPASQDHTSRRYYNAVDLNPAAKMTSCQSKLHQDVGRGGTYKFTLPINRTLYEQFPDWNGMVYVSIYDPQVQVDDSDAPEITHRMVMVLDAENPTEPLDCYYFGFKEDLRIGDNIASFARTTPDERRNIETCSN